ncbi:MAG: GGDEF domain-containing protein [Candidatus Edwardsbacteria bacterium]
MKSKKTLQRFSKEVIDALAGDNGESEEAIRQIESLRRQKAETLYSDLIQTLTHLYFPENEAKRHWSLILHHKYELGKKLRRPVGVRVAILDYFTNLHPHIKNPKIVELEFFEKTILSAITDGLTGLYNHRYFQDRLEEEIERSLRYQTIFSLTILDLDDFKIYNDTNGHLAGDILLIEATGVVTKAIRRSDLAARYGGDEFTLILPHTSKKGAYVLSERIRKRTETHRFPNQEILPLKKVTLSGGIATFPEDSREKDKLIASADKALYQAKQEGKNRILACEHGS